MLATVKVRPGEDGAWGEVSATADLDSVCARRTNDIRGRGGRMLAARVKPKNARRKTYTMSSEPLTKKAPYKPYAGKPPVRFCAGGVR